MQAVSTITRKNLLMTFSQKRLKDFCDQLQEEGYKFMLHYIAYNESK